MDYPGTLFSELLQTLYAAPLDETQWRAFLWRLCEVTRSAQGLFFRNDSRWGNRMMASGGSGLPEGFDTTYNASHRHSDPFHLAFLQNPRTGIIEGEDLVPHEHLITTEIYRTMLKPLGIEYMTSMVLSATPRSHNVICLWREKGRPRLESDLQSLLANLLPHVQNALAIRRALGVAENRMHDAAGMLDASQTASILLDARGVIVHMNRSAERLTEAADGICVGNKRVLLTDRSRAREFERMVSECAAAEMTGCGGAVAAARSRGKRPLQIMVSPFRLAEASRSTGRVLVLVTDPDRRVDVPDQLLQELYRFTPAETEIAHGLLTGFSLEEIALLRRASVATVRSQVKSLFGKTETRRQGDLIRLLATLPSDARTANL